MALPLPVLVHTTCGWSLQRSGKDRVPAQRIFPHKMSPDLSPDLPLPTICSITLQRTPQGWETSPKKAPHYHQGELANNLI